MKLRYYIFFSLSVLLLSAFTVRNSLYVENKSFHKLHEAYNYTLDVNYPKVYNEKNTDYNINISVQQILTSAITDFQKKVSRIKPREVGDNNINSLDFNYKILAKEDGFFSVKFTKKTKFIVFDDEKELIRILNYNISKNKPILLKDLFLENSNYESALVKIIQSKIPNCDTSDLSFLNDFNISKEYLIFNLDNLKKAPKNCQKPVHIPWRSLKNILNQEDLNSFIK